MKKKMISGTTGVLALLLIAGCRVTTPGPVADANTKALTEPISYYGDVELFDEKSTPLIVRIAPATASEDTFGVETLKNCLNRSNVKSVSLGKPCDIQISINSTYQELTPAPQCRLSHVLAISVASADGTPLLPVWEHKTETMQAYATSSAAKSKLKSQINESIKLWGKNHFRKEAGSVLNASVVRFKMSRKLIELNPIRFEEDVRAVLNKLRKIDGVVEVRMIESNKETRIASFRVLSRENISFNDEIQKQK